MRDEREETKVKSPTRKTDVWATQVALGFIVRATRRRHRAFQVWRYYHAKGKLSGYVPLEQQANGNQGQGET
jgi:hypothetical protein